MLESLRFEAFVLVVPQILPLERSILSRTQSQPWTLDWGPGQGQRSPLWGLEITLVPDVKSDKIWRWTWRSFLFCFFFISGVMRSPFLLSALRSSGHILGHFQGGLGHDVFWTLRNVSGAFTAVMKFTYTSQYKVALPFILLRMEQ